jgi:hypothetical protein
VFQVLSGAGHQTVNCDNLMAFPDQPVAHVRAYKSGRTRDNETQSFPPYLSRAHVQAEFNAVFQ